MRLIKVHQYMSAKNESEESRMAALTKELSSGHELENMCHMLLLGSPMPSEKSVERIVHLCRRLIFPGFFGDTALTSHNLPHRVGLALEELHTLLAEQISAGVLFSKCAAGDEALASARRAGREIATAFVERLPKLRALLAADVTATYEADPAALSTDEVVFCYPGIRATACHRIAHELLELGVPMIPRMISELAHRDTGIDIHPAATIGERFVIDHGTGVVIGATTIIGNRVKIYQGVTLGARSIPTDENDFAIREIARHPIIGDDVVIYSNASVLGRINIGAGAIIGGNVWVTEPVAPGERVVQGRARESKIENTNSNE